ncbi:MAG: dihydroneopterin aldolase [bacterium]|nr:dihydroneopterin aldolase [bacterium]
MKIRIKNLRVPASVGVHAWEKDAVQTLVINVELEFDGGAAASSDRLKDAVDYQEITRRLVEETRRAHVHLLEALADRLLDLLMKDERVASAAIEIDKPGALALAESVSVSASRRRED